MVDLSRFEAPVTGTYEELLALVPEINVIALRNERRATAPTELAVCVWNGERGRFVLEEMPLPSADVYLLNEMDAGMARTGNVHTVRVLAERLGLSYLFAVEFLELTKGEPDEREAAGENDLGFHGNAVLTSYEIRDPRLLRLEGGARWLQDEQKRIGSRTALICCIETEAGPVRVVCIHLESESPPSLRARQMAQLMAYLGSEDERMPTIIGGDLNTWSFDKRDKEAHARLADDPETPDRLLRPMAWEPLFDELAARGYAFEETNDLTRGTYPVPGFPVEARLDWIVVKALEGKDPVVIPSPHSERLGRPISDHHAVRARCVL